MLQNARVTAFIVFELLKENQQGGAKLYPAQIGVKSLESHSWRWKSKLHTEPLHVDRNRDNDID